MTLLNVSRLFFSIGAAEWEEEAARGGGSITHKDRRGAVL